MKKLLIIVFTLISLVSYSQAVVDSSGQLRPLGSYPIASAKDIKGAQRTVPTLEDRNAIPVYLRDTGMLVYVTTLDSTYQLKGGIANANWITFRTGGKGNSKTILDTVQTTGNTLDITLFSGGGRVIALSTVGANGSNFNPTYVTAFDSTYITYDYAPNGQVIYKMTVLDASDTLSGGGNETGPGGGGSGVTDTLFIYHKDTTYSIDTSYIFSKDTIVAFGDTLYHFDTIIVYTDTSGGVGGPVDYNTLINKPTLSTVATTGAYSSLTGLPALKPVATSGVYADLTGKPTLAIVATSGAYTDLTSKPALATVATSGLYTDLSGRPTLALVAGTGQYNDLINKPTLSTVATTGAYSSLTGLPALKPVATSGVYADLTGRPTLSTVATSGLYADLLSKPTLSTVATTGAYTDLTGRPALSTVATTGAYADLSGKPAIPAQVNLSATAGVIVSGTYPNLNAKVDTVWLNNYLVNHSVITVPGGGNNVCYAILNRYGLLSEKETSDPLQQFQLTQRTGDSLGIPIVRQGLLANNSGNYGAVISLLSSNRQTALNIRNTPEDGSRNFTSNTERAAYVTYLDTLFRNTLSVNDGDTLMMAANEEANKTYHTLDTSTNLANQSAARYWNNELKPLDSIANLYGTHFKVSNGGATGEVGWWFVWRNLMDSGRTADANEVAQAAFAPGTNLTNFPASASFALPIKFTLQLLPFIRSSNIEYWNWHIKMVTNGNDTSHINNDVIGLGVEAWKNLTGKNIITSELASTSMNPNIIAEEISQCSKYMDYIILYDGSTRTTTPTYAGADVSFRNTNNSINTIGTNIRNVIQAIKR